MVKNIKIYPISDGHFVVSYYDFARKTRVQKKFEEYSAANTYISGLKTTRDIHCDFKFLKTASTETAVRVYLEQNPGAYLASSKKLVREFLEFFSAYGVARLDEANLRLFFTYYKGEFGLSERTLLVTKSRLQGFFKFLIANGAIESSPIDGIKFDRGAPFTRQPLIFSEEKFEEFIAAAKRLSPALFYPIFLLIRQIGAKKSDIIGLQWKDVNFKTSRIQIKAGKELGTRTFVPSFELSKALSRIEKVREEVFSTLEGKPLKTHIIGRELKRFQRQAGLGTNWGLQDLRASYGVDFLKYGGSLEELKTQMGHSHVQQTREIFGRYLRHYVDLKSPEAVQGSRDISISSLEF